MKGWRFALACLCGVGLLSGWASAAISGSCETDADCDDQQLCTNDFCFSGQCVNDPVDCDDDDGCTTDSCDDATGRCGHQPLDCDDRDACTTDVCASPSGNCVHTPIDCSDDDLCTEDACDSITGTCSNPPLDCDDADPCTLDSCDPDDGACLRLRVDCNDNNACTVDSCDGATGECVNELNCDDGDPCTADSCDEQNLVCAHAAICGACCLRNGDCVDGVSAADCAAEGGDYQENGSDCDRVDCAPCELSCAADPIDCPPVDEPMGDDDDDDDDGSAAGDDDDDDDDNGGCPACGDPLAGDDDDDDGGSGGTRTQVHFESNCSTEAVIDIGCEMIPVMSGQIVQLDCGGDEPPATEDLCEDGKPCTLTMVYTGENCQASDNDQPNDVCSGDPQFAASVYIVANDSDSPDDGPIWFAGPVLLNGSFDISALNAGETRLKANTSVHILNRPGGTVLQFVEFHTSCSKPLALGDQYGALKLVGFVSQNQCEGIAGDDDDDGGAGPECSFSYCDDVLYINSRTAILNVTGSDADDIEQCMIDLCEQP